MSTIQKSAWLYLDPAGTNGAPVNLAGFAPKVMLKGKKGEEEVTTLADLQKVIEKGLPEAEVSISFLDKNGTFRTTIWLPAYQSDEDSVLGFRPDPGAVSASNPEVRVKVVVGEDELMLEWGKQRRYEYTLKANAVIYTEDGVTWREYHSGTPAVAF